MKIKVDYFDNIICLSDEYIMAIEIENKKYFYRFVSDLINKNNEDIYTFNDNCDEINIFNNTKVVVDYFSFTFNSRKFSNDLEKYVTENITVEDKNVLLNQYNKLLSIYNRLLNNFDLPLVISDALDINSITKVARLEIDEKNDLISNLLLMLDIEKNLGDTKLLVFINLKQYLSVEELKELYKYSLYIGLKLLLVDSQTYGVTLSNEKKYIIDENLDEFML